VSYNVIYPWLVFTTILKGEAELLSARPEFQYRDKAKVLKPFVDPTVYTYYTNNRQFRLLLNCKLSDPTKTALNLAPPPCCHHSHCPASPTSARMFGECRPSQSPTCILGPYENLPWVGPCANPVMIYAL
jgi:hypothetical protein